VLCTLGGVHVRFGLGWTADSHASPMRERWGDRCAGTHRLSRTVSRRRDASRGSSYPPDRQILAYVPVPLCNFFMMSAEAILGSAVVLQRDRRPAPMKRRNVRNRGNSLHRPQSRHG
jgi:hypothetical protein